jgi:hypothetical protein
MELSEKDIVRFWSKVKRGADNECWEWQAAQNGKGYGHIYIGGMTRKNILAHRISYQLIHGAIPDGMDVCHKCDNPGCVNPNHLFAGTASDNGRDMVAKGRQNNSPLRGEQNGNSKLTTEKVIAIRRAHAAGAVTMTELGRIYGVDASQIRHIIKGEQWVSAFLDAE